MRIGVHPTPRQAFTPPLPLHTEVIAWFGPAIPPADERTVIVRIAGRPGTWPAFHHQATKRWICAIDGCAIDDVVEAWAERPTGEPPQPGQQLPSAGAVVVKLDKSGLGTGFRLTKAGRDLPAGNYELQLVATITERTPA